MYLKKTFNNYNLVVVYFIIVYFLNLKTVNCEKELCKDFNINPNCIPHNCMSDEDCHEGSPGKYSRCRRDFGFGICECFYKGKYGVTYNDTCLLRKQLHSQCKTNAECILSLGDKSLCSGILSNPYPSQTDDFGICDCVRGARFNEAENRCYKTINNLNEKCSHSFECSSELGELSRCSSKTQKCECYDVKGASFDNNAVERETGFYKGKCYYVLREGERCEKDEECILGFNPHGICSPHESYRNESVCMCPQGENCERYPPVMNFATSGTEGKFELHRKSIATFNILFYILFLK